MRLLPPHSSRVPDLILSSGPSVQTAHEFYPGSLVLFQKHFHRWIGYTECKFDQFSWHPNQNVGTIYNLSRNLLLKIIYIIKCIYISLLNLCFFTKLVINQNMFHKNHCNISHDFQTFVLGYMIYFIDFLLNTRLMYLIFRQGALRDLHYMHHKTLNQCWLGCIVSPSLSSLMR